MAEKAFAPITPGQMLKDEFLAEFGLSQNRLAKAIGISPGVSSCLMTLTFARVSARDS